VSITSGAAAVTDRPTPSLGQIDTPLPLGSRLVCALVAIAAFGIYWYSSFILEEREGTTHFAADTWFYTELAEGNVFNRITENSNLARIFRFHPTTVVVAAGWMKLFGFLTPWIEPLYLLKALFAAVGAVGVWAAMLAFAALVPHRYVALWGAIYASSLGVWYFSSIEESKIVTATLSALYIATYLRLRKRWAVRSAVLLTAILLFACLNEIVAGFLVIIPVVDTLVQRGWDLRHGWWIVWHGLAGPIALAILEGIGWGWAGAAGTHAEGANHFSMLIWYLSKNYFNAESLYAFAVRWFFFNIAAPETHADHWADPSINYGGDFQPVLAKYFSSPISASLVILFGVILVATVLPRHRIESGDKQAGILLAFLAYTLLRGMFFFIFNSKECLLFSSSVTLAHLLMIGIPFTASILPAKRILLLIFAGLLFGTNGAFIIGDDGLLVPDWR